MAKDDLGDRMKLYEGREAKRRAMPRLPVLIRLDGKAFHTWTRGLERPFDARLEALRRDTTAALIRETGALLGYMQSDEITLLLYARSENSRLYADGRYQKLASLTASIATAEWNARVPRHLPEKTGSLARFDSRVWEVPNLEEAANVFMWREWDATKNSIQMAAQAVASHKRLHGMNGSKMQDLLMENGINWNNYEPWMKRGTFMRRVTVERAFTEEELSRLPPKHAAHKNPSMKVTRSEIRVLDVPPFKKVTNRVGFLLGAEPLTDSDSE